MKKVELEFTDKEYAMLIAEAIYRKGKIEDIPRLIAEKVRTDCHSSGYQPFDEIIINDMDHINKTNKIIKELEKAGLHKFIKEIPCGDEEISEESYNEKYQQKSAGT